MATTKCFGDQVNRGQRYDAFVSYSHALNARFAPAVQSELQGFAKPWYRARALRIFRDQTNLSADPGLWATIEGGLRESRWFILLASPEAARSAWVAKEVEFWLRERSVDTLLIAVVDGSLVWDGDDVDWSRTTALPDVLRGAFTQEPRWVDMRWLSREEQVARANPRFRECIAELAAPLRGLPKDELIGEHIRQHRRNMRAAWGAVSSLAVLLVIALVASVVAVHQGRLAQQRAFIAMARLLASESSSTLATQLDLSQLLAVEAQRMLPGPESSAALLRSVTATPQLAGNLVLGSEVTTVTSQGEFLVAGTGDGRVLRWPIDHALEANPQVWETGLPGPTEVALSGNGSTAATTDGKTVLVRDVETRLGPVQIVPGQAVRQIALSPDGRWLAVNTSGQAPYYGVPAEIVVYETGTGAEVRRAPSPAGVGAMLAFPDSSSLRLGSESGAGAVMSVPDLRVLSTSGTVSPFNNFTSAYSQTGDIYGYVKYNRLTTFPARPWSTEQRTAGELTLPIESAPEAIAIAPGGKRFAVVLSGVVHVGGTEELGSEQTPLLTELRGSDRIGSMVFSGDGRYLVAAAGDSIVVWDLEQPSSLAQGTGAVLEDPAMFIGAPGLAIAPDGEQVLATQELSSTAVLRVRLDGNEVDEVDVGYDSGRAVWTSDGDEVLLVSNAGGAQIVDADLTEVRHSWDQPPGGEMIGSPSPGMTARVVDGNRVVLVDRTGRIVVRALPDGEILHDLGRDGWPGWTADDTHLATTAVDVEGLHVAMSDSEQVLIVNLETGEAVALQGGGGRGVRFTPDGRLLVQRQNGMIELWDAGNRRLERTLDGGDLARGSLVASPDGRFVAGQREDGGVVLLDYVSGQRLGVFPVPPPVWSWGGELGQISRIEFSADSRELFSISSGGELLRWPLDPDEWRRRACERAGREITAAEWQRVVGVAPPEDLRCIR